MIRNKPTHPNEYVHKFETFSDKESILRKFFPGWKNLIEDAYQMISMLPTARICGARRCIGMLHLYIKADTKLEQDAAEGIAWKIERMSCHVCERCGNRGKRRKALKRSYCFCNACLIEHLNGVPDPVSEYKRNRWIPLKNSLEGEDL